MEQEIFRVNTINILRQRNLFAAFSILALVISVLLTLFLFMRSEKVILVPGLNQEVWATDNGVSSSYLEESASMYLPMLLDIDNNSIEWKREHLLRYIVQSDKRYLASFNEYFAAAKEKYKQFSLSTHFALKKLDTNSKDLTVIAHGELISRFGSRGMSSESKIYALSFSWIQGRLLLKEFVSINQDEK